MTTVTIGWRWRNLGRDHRRWIVLNAVLVTAAINSVLNGVIAWLSVRGHHTVPLWAVGVGKASVITDTVATLFFLPLMTCVMCTTAVRAEVRSGRLPPLTTCAVPELLRRSRLRRGVVLGTLCTAVLSPLAIVALFAAHVVDLSVGEFVFYKVLLAVVLGAVVTPVIALCAMADEAPGVTY